MEQENDRYKLCSYRLTLSAVLYSAWYVILLIHQKPELRSGAPRTKFKYQNSTASRAMLSRGQAYPLLLAGSLSLALLVLKLPRTPPPGHRPQPYYVRAQELQEQWQITEEVTQEQKLWQESSGTEQTEDVITWAVTPRKQQCHPIQKVGFAKTHKTASSTVQNVLLRWGLQSSWNWALYPEVYHLGPLSRPFEASWLEGVPWRRMVDQQGYNAVALHTVWSQTEVGRLLGREEARYVTILRDPVDQFESLYSYVHFDKKLHMGIERFVTEYVVKDREVSDRIRLSGQKTMQQCHEPRDFLFTEIMKSLECTKLIMLKMPEV